MRDISSIMTLYRERKAKYALLHSKMQDIADIYNGRAEIPLPDMQRDAKPSIPNLLQQGVDQMAGRITSVTPMVQFASARPGHRRSDRNADAAGQTVNGWWEMERLPMKQQQRGRRLIAYGMSPVVVRWDYAEHRPYRHIRHPLETFPSPDLQPGQVTPGDCIFSFRRSYGWMMDNGYGPHLQALIGRDEKPTRDGIVNILEYIDADHTCLIATGYFSAGYGDSYGYGYGYGTSQSYAVASEGMSGILLEAYENMTDGLCPVVIPTRLTLDEMTGQFDGMTGMYYHQARLMALETIAVEKGIFPDTYLVSRQGEQARFIEGPYDGRTGRVNIIAGGDIKDMQTQPGYMTQQTIDRLERNQRVTTGTPAEFGGESGSNIRTGRRGDAVLSATIDFPIAEAQGIFGYALQTENRVGIRLAKRIDKDTPRTLYVGAGNSRKPVTYIPTVTFEVEEHVISYPVSGTDVNSLVIGIGQRVGLGTMSHETAQRLDPYIENPEFEHDAIIAEGLEQAIMQGILQQAQQGAIPPLVLSKIMTLVKNDKMELAEALTKVTEDAMKAQAEQQAQQAEAGAAPPASADAAMAGAATGALAGPQSSIPGANQGQQDLAGLLSTLRKPAMTITPFRGQSRGAL